jgi:polyphosphate kinase 2 (PPK2 family)
VFLHLSKAEQRRRFLSRIDHPHKAWKLEPSDVAERARWDDYQAAYGECLGVTSSRHAPWLVIPADDKKTARLLVSQAVLDALQSLHPRFPSLPPERQEALADIRKELAADD